MGRHLPLCQDPESSLPCALPETIISFYIAANSIMNSNELLKKNCVKHNTSETGLVKPNQFFWFCYNMIQIIERNATKVTQFWLIVFRLYSEALEWNTRAGIVAQRAKAHACARGLAHRVGPASKGLQWVHSWAPAGGGRSQVSDESLGKEDTSKNKNCRGERRSCFI